MAPPNPQKPAVKPAKFVEEELIPATRRLRPPVKFQPPLMPLIDVMFTLMLFFLVSCQYRQAEGVIPANMPEISKGGTPPPIKPIHISLHPVGPENSRVAAFTITEGGGGSGADINDATKLYDMLHAMAQAPGMKDAPVTIEPSTEVPWGYVVQAFNQAVRCEFKNIGFSE